MHHAQGGQHLELVLQKPSTVVNTRFFAEGKPRYRIATLDRDAARMEVTDLRTNQKMSLFERLAFFADKVQFACRFGGNLVKEDEWIMERKLERGHDSGRFMWRWDAQKSMIIRQLLQPTGTIANICAQLTPKRAPDDIIAYVKDEPSVFALIVKRADDGDLDEIVLAFAVLEQYLRQSGREIVDRIDAGL